MKTIFTLFACLLITVFSSAQNCNNWLKINNAFDAVTLGDLDITGTQMTIEGSFNATGDITRTIVSKHYYSIDVNYHLLPDLAEITTTNGFFFVSAPCVFIKNKTYHVAMVYDGATLKLYRNGYLMGSTPATGSLITNNWPTAIGENSYGAFTHNINNSHPLKGYINEVKLWNVARTQAQIQTFMNISLPSPSTQTGLLAYYSFDNLQNKQGNIAFNGNLSGTATINNINPNCLFIADSICITASLNCNNWLKINNAFDAVTLGDLDITGTQMTIEGSFNATGDITRTIVSKHYYSIDVNYHLLPDLAEITTTNGFFSVSAPCVFIKNKIYHVAMVYDGATLKLYRNGYLMGSTPATGSLITNNWPTAIGENSYGAFTHNINNSHPLKGYINEVKFWNVARTQAQLKTYMNLSLPSPSTQIGLLAYYSFDNLQNKQGNIAFDGNLAGTATINNTNPNCLFLADSCFTILPVSLTSIKPTVIDNKKISLQWNTEAEIGIKTYTIERSAFGASGFISLGTVLSTNNLQRNSYTYTDNTAEPNVLYYYRLAVVESSGQKHYSPTRTAKIINSNFYISAYPSPTNGIVKLQLSNFTGTANIKVINNVGQVVMEKKIIPSNSSSLILDISRQPKGNYWINVQSGTSIAIKKIVKL